jgi:hypothetical protein
MGGLTDRAGQLIVQQFEPYLAQLGQILNPTLPARSNLSDFGTSGLSDGALAATGVAAGTPVRVIPGDKFSKIGVLVGATAAGTPTHSGAGLYAGVGAEPALLAKSADGATAAIAEKALFSFTLAEALEVTEANAPKGFVYASVTQTATTVSTAVSGATPTGINYKWVTGAPLFLGFTHGSALAGVLPAKIESAAAKAVAPIIILY